MGPRQGGLHAGEVQFGQVVDDEDDAGAGEHAAAGGEGVGQEDGLVGDGGVVGEVDGALVVGACWQAVGQGPAGGLAAQQVGGVDEPVGSGAVAEVGAGQVIESRRMVERRARHLRLPSGDLCPTDGRPPSYGNPYSSSRSPEH